VSAAPATLERTTFRTSRLLEFCSRKELVAQTGTEPAAWPLMIIKELVDNGLDACEEAGIAPVIRVTVARGKIRVRDNGPGIPPETVASILDFTTRTSSRDAMSRRIAAGRGMRPRRSARCSSP
jgi:DNA topoisomerase VI subunit B